MGLASGEGPIREVAHSSQGPYGAVSATVRLLSETEPKGLFPLSVNRDQSSLSNNSINNTPFGQDEEEAARRSQEAHGGVSDTVRLLSEQEPQGVEPLVDGDQTL